MHSQLIAEGGHWKWKLFLVYLSKCLNVWWNNSNGNVHSILNLFFCRYFVPTMTLLFTYCKQKFGYNNNSSPFQLSDCLPQTTSIRTCETYSDNYLQICPYISVISSSRSLPYDESAASSKSRSGSNVFSFNIQYLLVSSRSFSSCSVFFFVFPSRVHFLLPFFQLWVLEGSS